MYILKFKTYKFTSHHCIHTQTNKINLKTKRVIYLDAIFYKNYWIMQTIDHHEKPCKLIIPTLRVRHATIIHPLTT